MNAPGPKAVQRRQDRIVESLLGRVPGYVPEWRPSTSMAGQAVLLIFARYMELLENGLTQVPERGRLAFLDMLGIGLLPAQGARAPLVFSLIENSPIDVTLPERSEVAAQVRPRLTSPSGKGTVAGVPPQSLIFSTEQSITLSRAQIKALYSIVPGRDEFADHTAKLAQGFSFFEDTRPCLHAIYLGHDELFALAGDISVILSVTLEGNAPRPPLNTEWEYLTEQGWLPFTMPKEDDTTDGFKKDGQLILRRECGPNAKRETMEGRTSYWIRGRLADPLFPDGTDGQRTVPIVNDLRTRVAIHKEGIAPDAAYADAVPLDPSKDFFPFGQQPSLHPTFYLASKEFFQRKGAQIRIALQLSTPGVVPTGTTLTVVWEYFDGTAWSSFGLQASAGTDTFTQPGSISFLCPRDWEETQVNGTKNFWLRVRVTGGNYGLPLRVTGIKANQPELAVGNLIPPVIKKLSLAYTYTTDPTVLDHCLTENDFIFADETEACRWPDRSFMPFRPVADQRPGVHMGFDQPLAAGLISLYVDVPQFVVGEAVDSDGSPFIWEYRSVRGWTELSVLDETNGYRRSGMVQFIGPPDAIRMPGLGGNVFRIRARLKPGERDQPLPVGGVWLNAVWASQSQSIEQEPLGITDGNPEQTLLVQRLPVHDGETLEIQEWTGRGERWRFDLKEVDERDLRFERNPATKEISAVWVRWHAQPHFYGATAGDRYYVIDRARGIIRLGDGAHGMTPAAGKPVRISYRCGEAINGAMVATVPAGAITELRMAVPYVASATNPVAATGGADTESLETIKVRGPQRIRHGGRGVSAEDLEWLAREATPEVARARCLSLTGPAGHAQRGWITVIVVSFSQDAQPQPSAETKRRVHDYLVEVVPATLSRHIRVTGTRYTPVGVRAEIVPRQAAQAAAVEARVRENVNQFLHPLTGGPDRLGWQFGQGVRLSQIARVIEETPDVDYATQILLMSEGHVYEDLVPVESDGLVASGDHELKLTVGGR
ncbi:MAG: baseplate J/gp47 family protein [Nitrospirota bacterium]